VQDYRDIGGKKTMTHNQVIFVGTVERQPKVFTGENPLVSLFLKGATERGSVFIPVTVRGELAQKLTPKVATWIIGDEVYVEGELDWESFGKKEEKKYQTVISAKNIYRIEGV